MIEIAVLSLFGEQVHAALSHSITQRALEGGQLVLQTVDIRMHAGNRHAKVDDSLYGGGTGLLLRAEPVWQAWQTAVAGLAARRLATGRQGRTTPRTLVLSPRGRVLDQALVNELAAEEQLVLICGHYEGIDERVLDAIGAEALSIGDYVLTGGELAACVLIDALARQQPGVLPGHEAWQDESHYDGRLECRQYTKPECWRGREVPPVLRSGHHADIARWRRLDGLAETLLRRPDLFARLALDDAEIEALWRQMDAEGLLAPAAGPIDMDTDLLEGEGGDD